MDAIYFSECAGWLHSPAQDAPRRTKGVVLCSALGRDERCTHRPLRLFADRLAAAGFPVLRFDYPGQGDSCDIDAVQDATPMWIAAIRAARARLMAEMDLTGVALGGLRLGATLALLAAEPAEPLMLLSPVISGRSWVAKLRFSAAQGRRDREAEGARRGLDADGLFLSPATCGGLADMDLLVGGPSLGPALLALPGRPQKGLLAALEARAQALDVVDFPGYDRLFIDPNDNEAPDAVFAAAALWLSERVPVSPGPPPRPASRGASGRPGDPPTSGRAPCGEGLSAEGYSEAAVRFGADLRGVLTTPLRTSAAGAEAVIFLNTGGDPKAGIGRFAAHGARRLAAEGWVVLRFDFAGVGDSPEPEGVARIHVYETSRAADLEAALNLLSAHGPARVFLVGVSAGGFHALWAVLRDPRFSGAFCISTIKLVWRAGDAITIGTRRWGRPTSAYLADLLNPSAWGRMVQGRVAFGPIASSIWARLAAATKPERLTRESRAFRRKVRAVADRNGRIGLLMGVEDTALDEAEAHFGRGGRRLTRLPGMTLEVVEGLDHGLVYEQSRVAALEALRRWLNTA